MYIIYIYIYIYIYSLYLYIYIYIFVWLNTFICFISKHYLHSDVLNSNGFYISNAVSVSSRKCSIYIVSVLLNSNFKHNLKIVNFVMSKLFMFNVRGTKIIVKLQKGYKNFLSYFELCGRGTKIF